MIRAGRIITYKPRCADHSRVYQRLMAGDAMFVNQPFPVSIPTRREPFPQCCYPRENDGAL